MHDRVATIRAVYDGWAAGDFQAGLEVFDPHLVFVQRPGFPDAGTYVGLDQLAAYTRHFLEPWDEIGIEAEELTDAGDTVVAAVRQRGAGESSGAATEFRYFQVWTFRGAKVIRLENFRERSEAFAAAGLAG